MEVIISSRLGGKGFTVDGVLWTAYGGRRTMDGVGWTGCARCTADGVRINEKLSSTIQSQVNPRASPWRYSRIILIS
ncbi:unnamed protein product [Nesidiocoris tenuis]|uniref:Uncharacterized protein n=1 Tax=Nesidiocoris tenuis TaxID=355587 RepID=A0A6H5G5Q2_9HEMI|nr:unnamed protein product [Nesidiocoris tenuis]